MVKISQAGGYIIIQGLSLLFPNIRLNIATHGRGPVVVYLTSNRTDRGSISGTTPITFAREIELEKELPSLMRSIE